MKKLLFLLICLPFLSFSQESSRIPFIDGKVQFDTVMVVKGMTAKEMYINFKLIISDLYVSGKAATDVSDDNALFLVVKGNLLFQHIHSLGMNYDVTLDHSLRFQFKDERMKICFSNLVLNYPGGVVVPYECVMNDCKGVMKYNEKMRQNTNELLINAWTDLLRTISVKLKKATTDDNW